MTKQQAIIRATELIKDILVLGLEKGAFGNRHKIPHHGRKVNAAKRDSSMENSIHSVDRKIDDTASRVDANAESTGIVDAGRGFQSGKKSNPNPTPSSTRSMAARDGKNLISEYRAGGKPSMGEDDIRSQIGKAPGSVRFGIDPKSFFASKQNEKDESDKIAGLTPTDEEGKDIKNMEDAESGELGLKEDGSVALRGPTTKTKKEEEDDEKDQKEMMEQQQQQQQAMGGMQGQPPAPGSGGPMPQPPMGGQPQ